MSLKTKVTAGATPLCPTRRGCLRLRLVCPAYGALSTYQNTIGNSQVNTVKQKSVAKVVKKFGRTLPMTENGICDKLSS